MLLSPKDEDPSLPEPPSSPWRTKAKIAARRSSNIKRCAIIVASLAFCVPIFLLLNSTNTIYDSARWVPTTTNNDTLNTLSIPPERLDTPLPLPSPAESPLVNTTKEVPVSPIAFSLIMYSENSAAEGAILVKSILMYTSVPVEVHIICDDSARTYLERRISLVKHPRNNVLIRFYNLQFHQMLARIEREGAITTDHSAGIPGLMKLFIHEILPTSVKKSIFIDTDAFFISDPSLLWNHFNSLDPNIAISMPTHMEQSAPEWHNANRICSCIMLLDLDKLRKLRLMDSINYRNHPGGTEALSPPAFRDMFGPPGPTGHYEDVKLGDQGYWWAIVSFRKEIFEHLSFDWEVSSCLMDMYMTGLGNDDATEQDEIAVQLHTWETVHQGQAILPKLVHFNCLDGVDRYYEWSGWSDPSNSLAKRWSATLNYHVGYKWLWLNQASTNDTILTIETVQDVIFLDESSTEPS
ncbi:hypothetical protein C8Q75DRAFT_36139 [Abortiporus biennis]|nr:hypothetical protein C8Q75DRAFT_36139 [Abortiporus biennis]